MGKVFLKSTIPILIFTSLVGSIANFSPPAEAKTERSYWTFSEILALEKELDAEAKEYCGGGFQCERSYVMQLMWENWEDQRYTLVSNLKSTPFQITRINPTEETVSIYYHVKDYSSSEFTGIDRYMNLRGLYLIWADDLTLTTTAFYHPTIDDKMGLQYVVDMDNGGEMSDGAHAVFAHTTSDGDTSSWLKSGEESVLSATGSNLINDTNHRIYYSLYTDTDYSNSGWTYYGELASDYESGMEYRLVFDKNDSHPYWLPKQSWQDDSDEPTSDNPTDELTGDNPTSNGSTEVATEEDLANNAESNGGSDKNNSDNSQNTDEKSATTSEISTSVARVPENPVNLTNNRENIQNPILAVSDTSRTSEESDHQNTSDDNLETASTPIGNNIPSNNTADGYVEVPLASDKKEEPGFPWWLIVLAFSGIFLILWWFIPVRRRKDDEEE